VGYSGICGRSISKEVTFAINEEELRRTMESISSSGKRIDNLRLNIEVKGSSFLTNLASFIHGD
jgi:hypothetical protein